MEVKDKTLAVLIDFENIAAGTEKEGLGKFDIDAVLARLKDKGRILIARSYGDWGRFARFKQSLLAANVTMYELTSHGMQDKNRADIATVVDCLELAFTRPYIDTFVIVSGDSDFTPLVLKLKELNKSVIGVGTRGSTSRLLINACDEFIFYDAIVQQAKKPRRATATTSEAIPKDRAKAFELLAEVLSGMLREDPNPPHASELKSVVLRRQPDFSEGELGYNSFGRFLETARDAGFVALTRDQKSGGYRVDQVPESDDNGAAAAPSTAPRGPVARKDGGYDDPYFPAGADRLVTRLNGLGMGAVSASTRLAVLEALAESTGDKSGKRRRVNGAMVVEDIRKRLRRTHPELQAAHVIAILESLITAGQLLHHRDLTPIRNGNAMFVIDKTPEKLNRVLADLYLRKLRVAGEDLSDMALLSEFLFGDRARTREVEEILAWLASPDSAEEDPAAVEKPRRIDTDDIDSLLLSDEPADSEESDDAAEGTDADGGDRKKKRRRRKGGKKADEGSSSELDDLLTVDDDGPVDLDADDLFVVETVAPVARKAPAAAAPSDDDLFTVEDAPAPKKSSRKAAPAPKPAPAPIDDAMFLQDEETAKPEEAAPKAKAARKAAPRKKKTADTTETPEAAPAKAAAKPAAKPAKGAEIATTTGTDDLDSILDFE